MLDRILSFYRSSSFDFRQYACPDDPLQDRFLDWVPYYRLKQAIARAIQPRSILEIGVRYGYSAFSFLDACPRAHYVGIDNNSEGFGGSRGSVYWAKERARLFHADFLIADSQEMSRFPGGEYDLIHIDGQQDGLGTYHDLYLALHQADFILVDGFFWSEENFQSACRFLRDHRGHIEYFGSIPGYAGELLIRVAQPFRRLCQLEREAPEKRERAALQAACDEGRFRQECGGVDLHCGSRSLELEHARLKAVFALASPRRSQVFADLSCGRGELIYQAVRKGADAIAVDLSGDAPRRCGEAFAGDSDLLSRVSFLEPDLSSLSFSSPPDRIVAADLVARLHREELDRLFALIARSLAPGGRLIVHTRPNPWYYRRGYPRQRKEALARGQYLPREPRSIYERLMNLNEQSPAELRRSLKVHFAHVVVWLYEREEAPAGSLVQRYGLDQCKRARGIFAVASPDPIDREELIASLLQSPLDPKGMNVELNFVESPPEGMRCGSQIRLAILLSNRGNRILASHLPSPVHLSYHWKSLTGQGGDLHDGKRTGLPYPVLPGEELGLEVQVGTPEKAGIYVLQLTLVQEDVAWFEQHCASLPLECRVSIEQ